MGENSHSQFRRLSASFIQFLLISFIVTGCGLESSIYYSPPNFFVSGLYGPIFLTHNTANNDGSFLGYDVYYRVYFDPTAATTDMDLISTLSDINNYTPLSALNKLTSMGFTRMFYLESENYGLNSNSPLLRVANVLQSSTYTILVNLLPNWYYSSSDNTDTIQLVRNISSPGSLASFNSRYSIGNADYADKTNVPEANGWVYIVMFAVAYGFDINSTSSSSTILSFPKGAILSFQLPSTYPIP
jgi:hypothetical protein